MSARPAGAPMKCSSEGCDRTDTVEMMTGTSTPSSLGWWCQKHKHSIAGCQGCDGDHSNTPEDRALRRGVHQLDDLVHEMWSPERFGGKTPWTPVRTRLHELRRDERARVLAYCRSVFDASLTEEQKREIADVERRLGGPIAWRAFFLRWDIDAR